MGHGWRSRVALVQGVGELTLGSTLENLFDRHKVLTTLVKIHYCVQVHSLLVPQIGQGIFV